MILRPLHSSQRSSSAVQINYHWCSIKGSFQISPQRMPLISTQHLPGVERLSTVPLPAVCEDEKLPAVLLHFPSVGGSPIMIDVNYAVALQWISPKLHTLHFLCSAKGICAYGWRVELQSGASVWNYGWQTMTSPLLMECFQLIRHIYCICVLGNSKAKRLCGSPRTPHTSIPLAPFSSQMWANFQTHTVNVQIGHS